MILKYILFVVLASFIYACSNYFKSKDSEDANWIDQKRVSFESGCACAKQPFSVDNVLIGSALIKYGDGSSVVETLKVFYFNKTTNELFLNYKLGLEQLKGRVCNVPNILNEISIPDSGLRVTFSANIFKTCERKSSKKLDFDAVLEEMIPVEH